MPSWLAIHEAAHVATVLAFRLQLLDVEMSEQGGSVGFVSASKHDDRLGCRIMDAAVALAGQVAEGTSGPLSRGDRELLARCRLQPHERATAENIARRVVRENQAAIGEIAAYLDRRGWCVIEGSLLEERFAHLIQKA